MENNITKSTYCTIDIFKFILSFVVVAIHVPPFASINPALHFFTLYLSRLAVPFFFICSGYFLSVKLSSDKTYMSSYISRILKLYIIWSIIYMPCILHNAVSNNANILQTMILWTKNLIFVGSYLHLWYLLATVVAGFIIALCLRNHLNINTILIFAGIFYIIGLIPQTYSFILEPTRNCKNFFAVLKFIEKIIVTTRNGLFEGFLFMSLGMLLNKKDISIKIKKSLIFFLLSMFLLGCELVVVRYKGWARAYDMFIFLVPASFLLFYIVKTIQLKYKPIYIKLRTLSSLIFFSHLLIDYILNVMFSSISLNLWGHSLFRYLLVAITTFVFSLCIMELSKKPFLKWLKNLY